MILLDTQVWVWWVSQSDRIRGPIQHLLERSVGDGLAVSWFSAWEVAKKTSLGKLELGLDPDLWLDLAIHGPGVRMVDVTGEILLESTRLPGSFHRDPADQIIVASARILDIPIVTTDERIVAYPHVRKATTV
ncbi:MAG: type II toxin-antitoxin system VapC family toxin [Dehalococcoidia bacterium]|nr:type II toxin-antitoxin system VapC family toxin [Dehalococcoidia bacterium]